MLTKITRSNCIYIYIHHYMLFSLCCETTSEITMATVPPPPTYTLSRKSSFCVRRPTGARQADQQPFDPDQ